MTVHISFIKLKENVVDSYELTKRIEDDSIV